MADREGVVAIGLLTERDLSVLGQGFRRIYRVEDTHEFDALLTAIDEAERRQRQTDQPPRMPLPPVR